MEHIDFISSLHKKTSRDYLERVTTADKAECATIAKKFEHDFWDGDRKYGYGGYEYDGRWHEVAKKMAEHYQLKAGQSVLDIGCGKGFLLYELTQIVPGLIVRGIDISEYAIKNSKEEVKENLSIGFAQDLSMYDDNSFDFVFTINTLHNLYVYDLKKAVRQIERISKKNKYILVESYRNERERVNLLYWQLTCECFYTPQEWEWLYTEWGYTGDYGYIFFE